VKLLIIVFVSTILITSGFVFATPAVAAPNENANDKAKGNAQVSIPDHAKKIAPGIFHLGFATHEGQVVEGFLIFHHKPGHSGGPGGGGNGGDQPSGDDQCYSLFAKGSKWKVDEPWLLNPLNSQGLSDSFLLGNLQLNIQKWENESGRNILGDGSITGATLVADMVSPDGFNEVYFADISGENSIAVTIVWGVFDGPPGKRVLVEWDQVYDDVTFDWSSTGANDKMDFENISTHEMGHSLGLTHPGDSCTEETMFAFANEGETKKRTLESGDINGINKLY